MNPFYDPTVMKKNTIKWWMWLFLWACPTYVAFEDEAVFYKRFNGIIYIVKIEPYPKVRLPK